MSLAIIGCGPGGLNAAKSALEVGLSPTIFEKTNQIGGVWRKSKGLTWDTMCANVSYFNLGFSDFEWPVNTNLFPNAKEYAEYLDRYAKHFNLLSHIRFNTPVVEVKRLENNKWLLTSKNNNTGDVKEEVFDFLIVSSGIFAKPRIIEIPNRKQFKGLIIHSKDYQELKSTISLKDKKVLIIGSVFSGPNISEDLANNGVDVTNVIRKPNWFISKMTDHGGKLAPYEFVTIFSRKLSKLYRGIKDQKELFKLQNQEFAKHCHDQLNIKELYIDPNSSETPRLSIVDNYVSLVRDGKIKVFVDTIKSFYENGVILNNDSKIEADIVIFCTGYYADLSFMDKNVLDILEFDEKDIKIPVILYRNTFRPEIPNLAFTGVFREPISALNELQGRWAVKLFTGKMEFPDKGVVEKDLEEQRNFRKLVDQPQFLHPDFVGYPDDLAIELKMMPDFDKLKDTDSDLYTLFYEAAPALAFYRLTENKDLAFKIISEASKTRDKYLI